MRFKYGCSGCLSPYSPGEFQYASNDESGLKRILFLSRQVRDCCTMKTNHQLLLSLLYKDTVQYYCVYWKVPNMPSLESVSELLSELSFPTGDLSLLYDFFPLDVISVDT